MKTRQQKKNLVIGFRKISVNLEGAVMISLISKHVTVLTICDEFEAVLIAQEALNKEFGRMRYHAGDVIEKSAVLGHRNHFTINFF